MGKKRKHPIPDFSSKRPPAPRNAPDRAAPGPVRPPRAQVVKPQATSAKSGHRGQ